MSQSRSGRGGRTKGGGA